MRHQELLPLFATALGIELAHLRWILLTKWKRKSGGATHLECQRKPL